MAFEDADIKEARQGNDCWHLVHSLEHNPTLGDVFPTGAAFSGPARHRYVPGAVAQSHKRNALLLVRQSSCLLLNPDDNDFDLLHADMDQGELAN